MAAVTPDTFTPAMCKAARAFLDISAERLAGLASVGVATVWRFESGDTVRTSSRAAMLDALQGEGVAFSNGDKPGVQLVGKGKA